MHTEFRLENLKGRELSEVIGANGKMTIEWILKCDGTVWTVAGSRKHVNETSDSIKQGNFLTT
jgi:hypothetical protein